MKIKVIFTVIIIALLITGCKKNNAPDSNGLKGEIAISGAWALYPLMVKWSEEFKKINPELKIDVSAGGAGKGMADTLTDIVDIGMVSREIYKEEIEKGAWVLEVAKDAVIPTINSSNPNLDIILKTGIKKSGFQKLFLSNASVTWAELVPGGTNDSVNVYTRSDSCGAAGTWADFLGKKQEDLQGVGVFGDPGLAEAVIKDKLGVGYNNINYLYDGSTKKPHEGIQAIPIDINENGVIDLDENFYDTRDLLTQSIVENKFPSPPARDLFIVFHNKPVKKEVVSFIRWILNEGQNFVEENGYIKIEETKLNKIRNEF